MRGLGVGSGKSWVGGGCIDGGRGAFLDGGCGEFLHGRSLIEFDADGIQLVCCEFTMLVLIHNGGVGMDGSLSGRWLRKTCLGVVVVTGGWWVGQVSKRFPSRRLVVRSGGRGGAGREWNEER